MSENHPTQNLIVGRGVAIHRAFQFDGQPPTNRPACGAGARNAKGIKTSKPVTCAKCLKLIEQI